MYFCTLFVTSKAFTVVMEILLSRKIGYPRLPIFQEMLVSNRKFGYPHGRPERKPVATLVVGSPSRRYMPTCRVRTICWGWIRVGRVFLDGERNFL